MFGHQDDNPEAAQIPAQSIDGVLADTPTEQPVAAAPAWQHPGLPLDDTGSATPEPVLEQSSFAPSTPVVTSDDASNTPTNAVPTDLLDIKQQALAQLTPLVSHLDLSPEERFNTTMMMIRSNDNQDLVKEAYAIAQQIPDEKIRAEALLDIINEINYFTQPQHPAEQ